MCESKLIRRKNVLCHATQVVTINHWMSAVPCSALHPPIVTSFHTYLYSLTLIAGIICLMLVWQIILMSFDSLKMLLDRLYCKSVVNVALINWVIFALSV